MLDKCLKTLNEKKPIRFADWIRPGDVEFLNTWQFLSAKPVVYLVNMTESDYIRKQNKWYVLNNITNNKINKTKPTH